MNFGNKSLISIIDSFLKVTMEEDIFPILELLFPDNPEIVASLRKKSFIPQDILNLRDLSSDIDDENILDVLTCIEEDIIVSIDPKLFSLEIDHLLKDNLISGSSKKMKHRRGILIKIKSLLEGNNKGQDLEKMELSGELLLFKDSFKDIKDRLMCEYILQKIDFLMDDVL